MREVDARGLDCPQPVIEAKKAVRDKPEELDVLVDNDAAKENVTRFGSASGYTVTVTKEAEYYRLSFRK